MNIKRPFLFSLLVTGAAALIGLSAYADQGVLAYKQTQRDQVPTFGLGTVGGITYPGTNWTVGSTNSGGSANTNSGLTGPMWSVAPNSIACIQYTISAATTCSGNSNSVIVVSGSADGQNISTPTLASITNGCPATGSATYTSIIGTNLATRNLLISTFGSSQTNQVTLTNVVPFFIPSY